MLEGSHKDDGIQLLMESGLMVTAIPGNHQCRQGMIHVNVLCSCRGEHLINSKAIILTSRSSSEQGHSPRCCVDARWEHRLLLGLGLPLLRFLAGSQCIFPIWRFGFQRSGSWAHRDVQEMFQCEWKVFFFISFSPLGNIPCPCQIPGCK